MRRREPPGWKSELDSVRNRTQRAKPARPLPTALTRACPHSIGTSCMSPALLRNARAGHDPSAESDRQDRLSQTVQTA